MNYFTLTFFIFVSLGAFAQENHANLDSLKNEIILLRADVNTMQVNLVTTQKRFKVGMAVATLGYAITIAGGLVLSQNKDLGNALLITGGVTGVTGTFLLVDAFKYLGRAGKNKRPN